MTSDVPVDESTDEPSWCRLSGLLKQYPSSAREVAAVIEALRILYPQIPGPFINYPDSPFQDDKPYRVHRTHLIDDDQNGS